MILLGQVSNTCKKRGITQGLFCSIKTAEGTSDVQYSGEKCVQNVCSADCGSMSRGCFECGQDYEWWWGEGG